MNNGLFFQINNTYFLFFFSLVRKDTFIKPTKLGEKEIK